jgi:hypothetical protein
MEPPLDRDDVVAIMEALFDSRATTDATFYLLWGEDGEEEEDLG